MRTMKIVGLGLFLLLAYACDKDEDSSNCEKLVGLWTCESWIEDGEEFLGDTIFIVSANLEFKPLIEGQGDFVYNIDYILGGPEMIIGSYTVNDDCDEVSMTPKAGVTSVFQYHFEGDQLIMEGTINTIETELTFRKI